MWIVTWRYNGKEQHEDYEDYVDAFSRACQLEAYGMSVTIHTKL